MQGIVTANALGIGAPRSVVFENVLLEVLLLSKTMQAKAGSAESPTRAVVELVETERGKRPKEKIWQS